MRSRMSRADRAKQFAPFAALKGYDEALRKKEKILVPKIVLGEDAQEELDYKMRQVRRNEPITVVYFREGEYIEVTGMVTRIDEISRILYVVKTAISFDDILDIAGDGIASADA